MENSIWTEFLIKNYIDPYENFNNHITVRCEELIGTVTINLLQSNSGFTAETAKIGAIALIMQQLIIIQHQNAPAQQNAMVEALFTQLPNLSYFRNEIINESKKILMKEVKEKIIYDAREEIISSTSFKNFFKLKFKKLLMYCLN